MPGAVRSLAALGLAVPGVPVSGIRYVQGARGVQAAFRHGPGMGVRRTDLHGVLHRAVLAAGVPVLPLRVAEVRQDRAGVSVPGTGLRSRWLVGADGLHSRVRRSLGLEVRTRGAPATGCAGTMRWRPGRRTSKCTGAATRRRTSPRSAPGSSGSPC